MTWEETGNNSWRCTVKEDRLSVAEDQQDGGIREVRESSAMAAAGGREGGGRLLGLEARQGDSSVSPSCLPRCLSNVSSFGFMAASQRQRK